MEINVNMVTGIKYIVNFILFCNDFIEKQHVNETLTNTQMKLIQTLIHNKFNIYIACYTVQAKISSSNCHLC